MQQLVNALDLRLATGYGALIGAVAGMAFWFMISRDESQAGTFVALFVAAGGGVGRFVAVTRNKRL